MPNYKIGIDVNAQTNDSARQIGAVGGALNDLDDAFGGGLANVGAFGITLGDLISPMGLATAGVGALAGAMVATGAHAMELAREVEGSTALMTTQLGLTDEAAQGFENTMRSIYENNYGESFTDIAASMVAVDQQLQRIGGPESQQQLQQVTELAISFADAFDKDVGESTSAAVTLMENFGLTATQAFGFLTKGQQEGLDSSGDFLDTIGEYSVQFAEAQASASEFYSILETGNAGGVLGTDKVADAFKEFTIRIVDDSSTTKDALAAIGVSYDELKQGFADGSITQVQAMQTVIDKINEIEDPIERNKAGVALFGTQWEDLTGTVLTEIDLQKTALEDLEGAAASLEEQYKTGAAEGEAAMRQWDNALVDLGETLNGLRDAILPALVWTLENFLIPSLQQTVDWLDNIATVIDQLRTGLDYWRSQFGFGGPDASAQAVSAQSFGALIPVATTASSFATQAAGTQVYQSFFIDRGDPDIVTNAAEIGVSRAQRARGQ